jgi:small-conductance mechanosensitive channel
MQGVKGMQSNLLFILQESTERRFDLGIVWRTIVSMAEAVLGHLPYLVVGIVVFSVFVLLSRLTKRLLTSGMKRTRVDAALSYLLARMASAAVVIFGFLVASVIIFPTFSPGDLIAGLGITSVALGFAFKDILQNFLAGILILWQRPFKVGDLIRVKSYEGTVENINVRATYLKTSDNERVVLPNGDVYQDAILVRTAYPSRRVSFTLEIGYRNSIEEAREVIHRSLEEVPGVLKKPEPLVYISNLASPLIELTVYFWIDSKSSRVSEVKDRVASAIKSAIDDSSIDLPYPEDFASFKNALESKESTKPSAAA